MANIKTVSEPTYQLELSLKEVAALSTLLARVGGRDGDDGLRDTLNGIGTEVYGVIGFVRAEKLFPNFTGFWSKAWINEKT